MFLILFTTFLIISVIICYRKKQYLYLFFLMLLFLPRYYGFEFSSSLPLLTAIRIGYLIFYAYVIQNKTTPVFQLPVTEKNPLMTLYQTIPATAKLLIMYFVLRIISNFYYITTYKQAIKTLFELLFEQLFLCIAVHMLTFHKEQIFKLIRIVIYASGIFFILGIFESLTSYRITDALVTVSRNILNDHYYRLGIMRSTVTHGLPGFFGNFCIIIFPLILFMYEKCKQKRYLVIILLDMFALLFSGCRSSILFFAIIVLFSFLMYFKDKERKQLFIKNALVLLGSFLLITLLTGFMSERLNYYYTGTAKSVLNVVGFHFDLNEGAPEGVDGYGSNGRAGAYSRTMQLSGIAYAASINPIFGLGSGAQMRGDVYYYYRYAGDWLQYYTYDMGYVEVFMDEGILGILGYACLFLALFGKLLKSKYAMIPSLNRYLFLSLIAYLICMLSTANMTYPLCFFIFIVLANNPINKSALLT